MNSRQRRKQAAQEHNDRIALMQEASDLRFAIYTKHGARVTIWIDSSNDSVRKEIARLRGVLEADTPPPRPVTVCRGSERLRAHQKLAMLATLAGLGALR
jgi:hypothetical protein